MPNPATPSDPLDLLAFGPHPDDVELFCGGLMLAMADRGYRTGIVDLTWGERASQGTQETRRLECANATAKLGLVHRENLELPDTLLPLLAWPPVTLTVDPPADGPHMAAGAPKTAHEHDHSQALAGIELSPSDIGMALQKIVSALRRLRPTLVVIPPNKERHPDHVATHQLLIKALFYANVRNFPYGSDLPPFQPDQVLIYPMRVELPPSFIVDTSAVVDRKWDVVCCYQSQVTQAGQGPETTLIGSPLALSSLKARDQMAGARIGTVAGEPYLSVNTLGLVDPIDHFRRNRFARPHFFGGLE